MVFPRILSPISMGPPQTFTRGAPPLPAAMSPALPALQRQPISPMAGDPMPTKPGSTGYFPPAPPPLRSAGGMFDFLGDQSTRLNAAAAMMMGRDLGESIGGAFAQVAKGKQKNKTIAALEREDPQLAEWVRNGDLSPSDAFGVLIAERKARKGLTTPASVQEWQHFETLSPEDQARYLRMKRANPYLDIGTGFVQPDPTRPGEVSGAPIIKENYQERYDQARGGEAGKAAAERAANLPQVEATAQKMLSTLDTLENHRGLSGAVGWQGNFPEWMVAPGGTEEAGFMSVLNQVQGQAFLQAFESLKGGGQITQIEGEKATQAITRLNRKLSETEFKAAIKELRDVINTGVDRARRGVVVDPVSGVEMPAAAAQPSMAPSMGAPSTLPGPQQAAPGAGGYRILSVD